MGNLQEVSNNKKIKLKKLLTLLISFDILNWQRKKLCKKMYKQMSNLLKKILTHKKMFVILLMR